MDYKEKIEKQIERLEEVQEKGTLTIDEHCQVAKTIEYLLVSVLKYEKNTK